jgi:hypothetical protein
MRNGLTTVRSRRAAPNSSAYSAKLASLAWRAALLALATMMAASSANAADSATTEPGATEPEESESQAATAPKVDPRALIARYYAGLHFGIDPGAVFNNGKVGFGIAARLEYGIDTGTVIIAPGLNLAAYFLDPNVYVGMPTAKLVLPIGWFVPFIEGGAGVGHLTQPSQTGLALLGAGGFMIHPSQNLALGAEGGYETILGTDFGVILFGPIFAIAF